jgi:tetratricopeptide (TPR) repeat protein
MPETDIATLKNKISEAWQSIHQGRLNGNLISLELSLAEAYEKAGRTLDAIETERHVGWLYKRQDEYGPAFDHFLSSLKKGIKQLKKEELMWLKFQLMECAIKSENTIDLELTLADAYAELGFTEDAVEVFCLVAETYMKKKEYALALQYFTMASEEGRDFFSKEERFKVYSEMMECSKALAGK